MPRILSEDGGATFDGSEAAPVTHIRWTLLAPLSPGEAAADERDDGGGW